MKQELTIEQQLSTQKALAPRFYECRLSILCIAPLIVPQELLRSLNFVNL